jgi:hypothetical protein
LEGKIFEIYKCDMNVMNESETEKKRKAEHIYFYCSRSTMRKKKGRLSKAFNITI